MAEPTFDWMKFLETVWKSSTDKKAIIKKIAKAIVVNLIKLPGGPANWIASYFISKFLLWAWLETEDIMELIGQKIDGKKAKEEYKQIINKPGVTPDEVRNAGSNIIFR